MFIKQHQQLLEKYKKENKPTQYEYVLEDILKEYNIRYMTQKGFLAKAYTCYIADFYIPRKKWIIEVDGEYHQDRWYADMMRDKYFFEERGIKTLRFKNDDVMNKEYVVSKLKEINLV